MEMVISPKWRRWEWMVCDCTGKVIVSGRELSRSKARFKPHVPCFNCY